MTPPPFILFTDLDGTLLDGATYSYAAAAQALGLLKEQNIPVILVSSKTRAEMEPLRKQLHNVHPFVVENGGGLFVPIGYFQEPLKDARRRGDYEVVELGASYPRLRTALKELGQTTGCRLKGFGDMTEQEIADLAGFSQEAAALARQREYDEPFVLEKGDPDTIMDAMGRLTEERGLRCTRGGRFFHLMGDSDKGRACRLLIEAYRQTIPEAGRTVTVAIGDSLNDLPMLAAVDRPVLVQRPDGTFDPDIRLDNLTRAPAAGPVGWNRAVLSLLNRK